jgi:signal transduction histidine kinase
MFAAEGTNQISVLVVDDDSFVLKVIQRLLAPEPYTLFTSTGPAAAIELLETRPIDILVCDYHMPEIDGVELLSLVARIRPEIVTILLTGHGDYQLAKSLINNGLVYKYIEKPWCDHEITDAVRDAANRYRLLRANRELQAKLVTRNAELEDLTSGLKVAVAALKRELELAMRHAMTNEHLALVGKAAAQIAHDLRNPLTTLTLSMGMMKLNEHGNGCTASMEIMEKSLEQITAMVEALPASVRQITAEPDLQPEPLDRFLRSATELMWPVARERGIDIECDADTKVVLLLDRMQMTVAIENLLKNALEVLDTGGRIRVSARLELRDAVIEVEDSGTGIPVQILDKLFTPFVSFGKPKGTGLGLAGAKSAVERHGGTISAENTGHGARFTIRLPRSLEAPSLPEYGDQQHSYERLDDR